MTTAKPYKFLYNYETSDQAIFFGREKETAILLSDIIVGRLVVLFAKTGTGKTSIINAGVRPLLEERGYKTFFIRVDQDPTSSVRAEVAKDSDAGPLKPGTLYIQLKNLSSKLRKPIVLFLDQFEEFFIYADKKNPRKVEQFISQVAKLYNNEESGVHIVFSMREEFFVEMDIFRDQIPTIFHNESNLRLRWFDKNQARDAITRPALVFNTRIEKKLVDKMIADLQEGGMIEPAQLQIVCDTLWQKKSDGYIKLRDYLKLGKSGEANIARQVFNQRLEYEFSLIKDEQQLRLLEKLLPKLKTDRNTKFVRDVDTLVKELDTDLTSLLALLEVLKDSKLVRVTDRQDLKFIELTHDYLVPRLDQLQEGVRLIWPRKILSEAMKQYKINKQIISPENLAQVSEHAERLRPGSKELRLLVTSALVHGLYTDVWFQQASRQGVKVWDLIREKLDGDIVSEAPNAIDLLVTLDSAEAKQLLRKAVNRKEITTYVIDRLANTETLASVKFLKTIARNQNLAYRAIAALARLSHSRKNPQAASLAEKALSSPTMRRASGIKSVKWVKKAAPPIVKQPLRQQSESVHHDIKILCDHFSKGRVIPLIGPGVYEPDVGKRRITQADKMSHPLTEEGIANRLAMRTNLKGPDSYNLPLAAQHYVSLFGQEGLIKALADILSRPVPIPAIYTLLAKRYKPRLIITTNYDDVLERAFAKANHPCHILFSPIDPNFAGSHFYLRGDGMTVKIITQKDSVIEPDPKVTIIYKALGTFPRQGTLTNQFVITEEDHIKLLSRLSEGSAFPRGLEKLIASSALLYLGYSLANRTQFALCQTIQKQYQTTKSSKAWAVQNQFSDYEKSLWSERDTSLFSMPVKKFSELLSKT